MSKYLNLILRYEEIEQDQDEGRISRLDAETLRQGVDREMEHELTSD
jgi:hypothetical protein